MFDLSVVYFQHWNYNHLPHFEINNCTFPSFCTELTKLLLFYFCDISRCLEVVFAAVAQACKNENFDKII
jgi:hypothetical protein